MSLGPYYYFDDHVLKIVDLSSTEVADYAARDITLGMYDWASSAIVWARVWREPSKARNVVADAIEAHGGLFDAEIGVRRFGASGVCVSVPPGAQSYLDALKALEGSTLDRAKPEAVAALVAACRRLRDEDRIGDRDRGETWAAVAKAFNEVERDVG